MDPRLPDPLRPEPSRDPADNRIDSSRTLIQPFSPDPRVLWAAERTALAWIRTGVGLIAFGFVLARAPGLLSGLGAAAGEGARLFSLCGLLLILLGAVAAVDGATRYGRTFRRLLRGEPAQHATVAPLLVASGVAGIGALIAGWIVWSFR